MSDLDEMIRRQHDSTLTERQRVERGLEHAEKQMNRWTAEWYRLHRILREMDDND